MKIYYQTLFDFAKELKFSGDVIPRGIECPAYSAFREGGTVVGHFDILKVHVDVISYGEKTKILKKYDCKCIAVVLGIALEGLIIKDSDSVDGRRLANSKEFIFIEEEKCLQT